ncbi:MAG: right-handed parallel beta-helix repeat-containing protein [Reichenbachiella sp.]
MIHLKCIKEKLFASLIIFAIISSSTVFAREIYVTKNGNDTNDGSHANPYLTISKAAAVAVAGDIVYIGKGTYEETLTPANSGSAGNPIVFQSIQGEKVIITAMQALSGFELDEGSIYKKTVDWTLGQDNFVMNGDIAMDLARWPNNEDGLPFTKDSRRNSGGSSSDVSFGANLRSSSIPNIDWTGGAVWFYGDKPGSGWIAWKAFITSSSSGRVNFDLDKNPTWIRTFHAPADLGDFYLEGVKGALDFDNEWWFDDESDQLFVRLPGSQAPIDGQVKMRKRKIAINLNNRNYIEIRNLAVFGGSIELKNNASHNVLYGISSFYGNHTQGIFKGFNANKPSVEVRGTRNLIEKCEIAFNAATGVRLGGTFNELKNCHIHDFNYLGSYDAPLVVRDGSDYIVTGNTIYNGGRDGINYNGPRGKISYNDVSRSNLIADDCGTFYTVGAQLGTELHHNWFHDIASSGDKKKAAGIYLDNDAKGFSVHHNVVWNTEWTGVQINWNGEDLNIFNNTFWNNKDGVMGAWHKDGTHFTNVKVWNNLSNSNQWEPQSDKQNNAVLTESPFIDLENHDFRISEGSNTIIDKGKVIEGITDGFIGSAPDIGAYEVGGVPWTAGIDWEPLLGASGLGCYGLPGEKCVNDLNDFDDDGISNDMDICPDTPIGTIVDENGCDIDVDGDGINNDIDQCPETPIGTEVDDYGCNVDADGDGVNNDIDECSDTPTGTEVDEYGCNIDSDGDGVNNDIDECPETPVGLRVDGNGCLITNAHNQVLLSIYPNPTKDYLNINSAKNISHVEVFDLIGHQHYIELIGQNTLNTSLLRSGVFVLKIHFADDSIKFQNFIKK